MKLILGLIWTLILHYQISIGFGIKDDDGDGKGGKKGKTGKQALLEWLQVSIERNVLGNASVGMRLWECEWIYENYLTEFE